MSSNYQETIEYLKTRVDKNYFTYTNNCCLIYLVLFYMYNDQALEAKKILVSNLKIKRSPDLMYTRFILAIAEDNDQAIEYYANKVENLMYKRYNLQKENVKKILEMLKTNIVNFEVYENTNFPLLKRICQKINGENVNIESLYVETETITIEDYKKCTGLKRAIKIFLNAITCCTLFLALIIVSVNISKFEPFTSFEGLYKILQLIWIFFLFLPISIGNIIYGVYLKSKNYQFKSNIIIGIIFSILLLLYGSMHFLSKSQYSEDKTYLYELEEKIGVDFPNDFEIVTLDWTGGKQTSLDNTLLKFESIVRINGENIKYFDTNLWLEEVQSTEMLPTLFVYETLKYDKFLVYCFDTNEYNPTEFSNQYEYVAIAYNIENNNLIIYEFYLK